MSKYIEDDWTGEYINENKSIYLVNGEIVNKDNLSEETVTYYYDDDGNEFKEDEVKEYEDLNELYGLPYKIKWASDIECADKEVEGALKTLADSIVRFKVVEDLIYRDIDIDIPTRKYIRTMITKFNRHFLPYVTEIIES